MGRFITRLVDEADDLTLHAGLSSDTPLAEADGADVLIDVSRIESSERAVSYALERGIDVVVGTSGWSVERIDRLEEEVPSGRGVIIVPNFSLGSVLGTHLSAVAGRFFDSVEIIEAHHDRKVDSPSGTAVRTAERIAGARADAGLAALVAPNDDQDARGSVVDGVAIHSVRLRGVVADQQVLFGGTGEVLSVRHETITQSAYERGVLMAIRAAPDATGVTVGLDALLGL
ncbi:4-hydroxy-tetrahydrodipicolinate reductase [Pseudoclavibacter endophyticus]|nr:4-hydroxy-tetrahydrodipicolinate reductase [Pseudoclavibacter endophyticus]